MPKVFYLQPDGIERVIEGAPGESVMAVAVRHGVNGIVGQCGGVLSCATCHVFLEGIEPDGQIGELEDEMLDCAATDRESTSRLSCQVVLTDGVDVRVRIPPAQL